MGIHDEYYKMLDPDFKYNRAFCTQDDIDMAKSIKKFVDKEIMPRRQDLEGGWHKDEKLAVATQHELYHKLCDLGCAKANLPVKYGGLGLSPVVRAMINEEVSRGDIGLATMLGKIHWIVSFMVACGREDLLEEFSPQIAGADPWTSCVCITESTGGANLEDSTQEYRGVRTIAEEDGDEWVINGHKIWPGPSGPTENYQSKDLKGHLGYWTVATTDPTLGADGMGLFLVPPDTPGFTQSKPYEKMGFVYADDNCELYYDNVRIPKKYRIDTEPGFGAHLIRGFVVALGRMAGSARLTGLSQACLEIVLDYAKHREIVGQPQRERSAFAVTLANIFRYIDVSRQYYLSTTYMAAHTDIYGPPWCDEMVAKFSAARSLAGDCAEFVTNASANLMGSYGYSYEFNLEKYLRDYKIVQNWLGGPYRDRLDISLGLYGPFKWAGYEEWAKKQSV